MSSQDLASDTASAKSPAARHHNVLQVLEELWGMTSAYAAQETVDPLRGLGRFLVFGIAGALAWGIGVVVLMVAALRALQTQTGDAFVGNLSWAPYGITLLGGLVVAAAAMRRISRRKRPWA